MSVIKEQLTQYERHVKCKKILLTQTLAIAQSQGDMIYKDETDRLKMSMEERERLTGEIDKIDLICAQIKDQLTDDDMHDRQLTDANKDIMEMLLQIQTADQIIGEQLCKKLKEYQNQIRQLRQTKKGMDCYARPFTNEDGIFFDKKK